MASTLEKSTCWVSTGRTLWSFIGKRNIFTNKFLAKNVLKKNNFEKNFEEDAHVLQVFLFCIDKLFQHISSLLYHVFHFFILFSLASKIQPKRLSFLRQKSCRFVEAFQLGEKNFWKLNLFTEMKAWSGFLCINIYALWDGRTLTKFSGFMWEYCEIGFSVNERYSKLEDNSFWPYQNVKLKAT